LRRIVADKANGELAGEELSGGGASGEKVKQFLAFALTVFLEFFAENLLLAGFVASGVELEFATALRTSVTSAWV